MKWVVSLCLGVILFLGYKVYNKEARITSLEKKITKKANEVTECKDSLKAKEFERFWSDEFSKLSLGDKNESDKNSSDNSVVFDSF